MHSVIRATTIPSPDWPPWTGTGLTPRSSIPRSARSGPTGSSQGIGGRSVGPSPTISRSSPPTTRSGSSCPTRYRSSTFPTLSARLNDSPLSEPARSICRISRARSVFPTTTTSVTTLCGASSRRPGSPSVTTWETAHWFYDVWRRDPTPQLAIFTSLPSLALSEVIAWWILTGTLERFPGLKIVLVEPSLYWVPGFLAQLDRKVDGPYDLPGLRLKPERVLPAQHGAHLHGRRGRSRASAHGRHREHPLVDRLPSPGHDLAQFSRSRRPPIRRHSR